VSAAKIAVERAIRRRLGSGTAPGPAAELSTSVTQHDDTRRRGRDGRLATIESPARSGRFHDMANIKQQKKRIRIAGDQRLENLRYRSTIKTLTKRLASAVEDGDADAVATEHRTLVRWIDKAVSRGALHRNTGARKKSQAARLVEPKS
jgi:small subunit ribosomal protein S20